MNIVIFFTNAAANLINFVFVIWCLAREVIFRALYSLTSRYFKSLSIIKISVQHLRVTHCMILPALWL